jgi:CheY-like chemotaxis protein
MNVLVIDDTTTYRIALASYVKACGHTPVTAKDGVEALTRLMKGDIELVITDRNMPNMDGLMLAARIKSAWPGIKVILVTTEDNPNCLKVDGYLRKPFKCADLQLLLM